MAKHFDFKKEKEGALKNISGALPTVFCKKIAKIRSPSNSILLIGWCQICIAVNNPVHEIHIDALRLTFKTNHVRRAPANAD